MNVIVENYPGPTDIDVKRFYVPAVIRWTCASCGQAREQDLGDHYLSYPTANADFTHALWCGATVMIDGKETDCQAEHKVKLHLELRLRLAESP